jgi:twitching motility protein PilT
MASMQPPPLSNSPTPNPTLGTGNLADAIVGLQTSTIVMTPASTASANQTEPQLEIETFLRMAIAQGVSDIHLRVACPPVLRKDGLMVITKLPALTEESIARFCDNIMPQSITLKTANKTDFDFSFMFENLCRFRVNGFYEMNQLGLVLRLIPVQIPTLEALMMPPVLQRFAGMHKGLVLMTGPTGSGKTTTLAALLNHINHTASKHIITLEDPVEFVYTEAKSVVTQRQMGLDTDNFVTGIKYALRQDPDVMLIGEMRDRETMMAAVHAAETGHMVFSTLHTTDAVQTINRIINVFEPHERDNMRMQLGEVLQGVVSQRLVPRADGKGRVAVSEILVVTPTVRDYILKNRMDEIYQLINNGDYEGMMSLNHSLYRAYRNGYITVEQALNFTNNETEFQQMIRGAYHGSSV